jgi:hypothetical protein
VKLALIFPQGWILFIGVGEEENIVIQGKNKREQYENSKILRPYRGITRAIFFMVVHSFAILSLVSP